MSPEQLYASNAVGRIIGRNSGQTDEPKIGPVNARPPDDVAAAVARGRVVRERTAKGPKVKKGRTRIPACRGWRKTLVTP